MRPRRLAASLAFAAIFFTGASFSAVAGTQVVDLLESDAEVAQPESALAGEAPAADEAPSEPVVTEPAAPAPAPAEAVPAPEPDPRAVPSGVVLDPEEAEPAPPLEAAPAPELAPEAQAAPETEAPEAPEAPAEQPSMDDGLAPHNHSSANAHESVAQARPAGPAPARAPAAKAPAPARETGLDPEASEPNMAATVWLHRALPDPTPASLRLAPATAERLRRAGRAAGVDWALLLGAVRADGSRGRVPVRQATLAETAARLAGLGARKDAWGASLALTGRTGAADRAVALAHYYRAVGLQALVDGLLARQDFLASKVLADERVDMYAGGREDVAAGRIDVRVLALIAYMAESHGQVTVSSLFSGHRLYSRPGVVSAHVYGQAVDFSALGGKPMWGNQGPGSVTEKAVRNILLLPAEMRPRQVISLLGLGGPSFPLADHADHIHVGF
jgi:hypothetical protein